MTERDALYRAILTSPDDDTPRLIFADYLDENGEGDQAEFVRVQVELARIKATIRCTDPRHTPSESGYLGCGDWIGVAESYLSLRSRELDLFNAHRVEWFGANAVLEHPVGRLLESLEFFGQWRTVPVRGFPAHWDGSWSAWVGGRMVPGIDDEGDYRISGACDTLAWRPTWEMECQGKASHVGGYWRCAECGEIWDWMSPLTGRVCEHRVPRPCPTGAVPLTDVTLTTIPGRFHGYANGSWLDDGGEWQSVRESKFACEQRWPGLRFHLPGERGEVSFTPSPTNFSVAGL